MTPGGTVVTQRGARLTLGRKLGGGGEGDVFEVQGSADRAVKIYHDKYKDPRAPKIAGMVAEGLSARSTLASFPIEPVGTEGGGFLGFVMHRVVGRKAINLLWSPMDRPLHFPGVDWTFLVRAAANAARAVAEVHRTGCVVGDLNGGGLLVSPQATVAMIDADSFQVRCGTRLFLSEVGIAEFTAPELRGSDFERDPRSRNHDRFALAVMIFLLLFAGREPYAGRPAAPDVELHDAIPNHRFAFSRRRDTGLTPPPAAPTLADLSPELADAFEAAFSPVGSIGLRPRASEWVELLGRFEAELVACSRGLRHRFHPHAGTCTWCRIEREAQLDLFPA